MAIILIVIVAAIHFYFMYLECYAWEAPRTRAAFGTSPEFAASTKVLALNQGVYNGFLAVGLVLGLLVGNVTMVVYLLACVAVAGVVAMVTGIQRALYFQTVPALMALLAMWVF